MYYRQTCKLKLLCYFTFLVSKNCQDQKKMTTDADIDVENKFLLTADESENFSIHDGNLSASSSQNLKYDFHIIQLYYF